MCKDPFSKENNIYRFKGLGLKMFGWPFIQPTTRTVSQDDINDFP